jgi:hypothetical protein
VNYPLFSTHTGWHMFCKRCRKTDLAEIGTGVSLYFKMLKYLIILFLLFSIISIPSFIFYASGTRIDHREEGTSATNYILSVLSIGNLGESKNIFIFYKNIYSRLSLQLWKYFKVDKC